MQNYFDGKYSIDHRSDTIFVMGIDTIVSVFRALTAIKADEETWLLTINFLFDYFHINKISKSLICALYFVDISKDKVLLHVIERFNQLSAEENYDGDEYYSKFLRDYLHQLYILKLISEPGNFNNMKSDEEQFEKFALEELLERTKYEKKFLEGSVLSKEYELVKRFVVKNIEICSNDKVGAESVFDKITCEAKTVLDQYVDDKKGLYLVENRGKWLDDIKKEYDEGKISIYKVVTLIEYDVEKQKELQSLEDNS